VERQDPLPKPFCTVEEAIEELRAGRMIVLVDDEDRENEGDLAVAAEKVTAETVNFMAAHGRGLVCLALDKEIVERLELPMMTERNESPFGTAFTVSIEARKGVTTGISAQDRATTIRTAVRPDSGPHDIVTPGHVFPLRAREGGTLVRAGQTEGIVDLARLAGLQPAGVICEIMNEDGTMARMPQLVEFCKKHNLRMCTVADIIRHRMRTEKLVECLTEVDLPTEYGRFTLRLYQSTLYRTEPHLALLKGWVGKERRDEPVLVRVHSECLTGDVFKSLRCDCGEQLAAAMRMIENEGAGAVLYMRQEGRGIGLEAKLRAYALQENGLDTVEANEELGFPADLRDYGIGAQILVELGLRRLRLLTNNPRKMIALTGYGLEIVERVPLVMQPRPENEYYLKTKQQKLGHLL